MLQRAADPQDRRSSLLSVTPEGHALMEELRSRKTAYLAHRLEGLDPEEQRDARPRRRHPRAPAGRGRSRVSAGVRRTFDSLCVPNYRRYFTGQVVSISGNWMQIVAEMWLIVQLTGSGVSVGLTAALQFLPMLLFGAWGGLLADRAAEAASCSSTRRR